MCSFCIKRKHDLILFVLGFLTDALGFQFSETQSGVNNYKHISLLVIFLRCLVYESDHIMKQNFKSILHLGEFLCILGTGGKMFHPPCRGGCCTVEG